MQNLIQIIWQIMNVFVVFIAWACLTITWAVFGFEVFIKIVETIGILQLLLYFPDVGPVVLIILFMATNPGVIPYYIYQTRVKKREE